MQDLQELKKSVTHATSECPAGDANCPHYRELQRLREENQELAALVRTDELTGLFNFRYFYQAVELEMERSRRSDQPTTLIMMDIDHFKEVNDQYGHETGNRTLAHVAKILRNAIRRLDIPCRYGGEEFALILPDTPLGAGVMFANRLRHLIENSSIAIGDAHIRLTASFGVDVYRKDDQCTAREFIDRADSLLYAAKSEGRNKVRHPQFDINKE
ncbi:MAG: GGDEF domain-containing protein [Gammaproteobacteria bacterium]|nr:GGDEF domain-containing protein [Pseudomonadales bacterium]MCP5349135.1 GGDEF domain-containing protein [Pseudomonadales bacterium]